MTGIEHRSKSSERGSWRVRPALIFVLLLPLVAALLPAGCSDSDEKPLSDKPTPPPASVSGPAKYVGSSSCTECHAQQHKDWHGSHHDLAMDLATPDKVLGDFSDASFESKFGVKSSMTRKGDEFFITTDGPTGKDETFKLKYVFGVDPLQQYLVEFPDGRVQCWNIAWDTKRKKWFDLQQHEVKRYLPDDPMHWTGWGNTWNHMCADCHSTNVERNYDLQKDTYNTTFSEIDVSCEACHGPASHHLELAKTKNWSTTLGFGLAKLKGKDATTQLETCAKCHSHHGLVHHGFQPGDKFDDHFALSLLDSELYYPDGQVHGEAYVYGSFLQSRMFREGVRCTDCHDPHTVKLKRPGNMLCTKCHQAEKYDAPAHHFHKVGSSGAACVECHMPERTYMVVDPRRDHNIRIPRPDLSVELGTPNACTKCHLEIKNDEPGKWPLYQDWLTAATEGNAQAKRKIEQLDQWAADVIVEKFGEKRPSDPHYGPVIERARRGSPAAMDGLIRLASSKNVGPVVKASAVSLLRNYHTPESVEAIVAATHDKDPRVRAAAVASLPMNALLQVLPHMLSDKSRLVRHEVTRMLSLVFRQLPDDLRGPYLAALEKLSDEQYASSDTWQTHVNLGGIFANLGDTPRAEQHFRNALKINKLSVPALEGLTQVLLQQSRPADAEKLWRQHLKDEPESFLGHFNLGLLIAENPERLAEATKSLARAVEISPEFARGHFNYGTALKHLKEWDKAEKHLHQAYQLAPYAQDFVMALAGFYREREQPKKAEEVLLAAVHGEPMPVPLVGALSQFYIEQKQPEKAAQTIRDALVREPDSVDMVQTAMGFYESRGQFEKTDETLRAALRRMPKSVSLLHAAMRFYIQQGDLEKAEIYTERLITEQPENEGARSNLKEIRRHLDQRESQGAP